MSPLESLLLSMSYVFVHFVGLMVADLLKIRGVDIPLKTKMLRSAANTSMRVEIKAEES